MLDQRSLRLTIVGAVLLSLPIFGSFAGPLLVREAIDVLTQGAVPHRAIVALAVIYSLIFAVSWLGEALYTRQKYHAAEQLRDRIFRQAAYLPPTTLREKGSAHFAQLIGNQVNDAFVLLDYGVVRSVFYTLRLIAIIAVVLTLSRPACLIFLAAVALVVVYSAAVDSQVRPIFASILAGIRRSNAFVVESLENLHELWGSRSIESRQNKHLELLRQLTGLGVRAELTRVRCDKVLVDGPTYLAELGLLTFGVHAVLTGQLTVGSVVALYTYLGQAVAPLHVFRDLSRMAAQSAANIDSILDFLEHTDKLRSQRPVRALPRLSPIYEVRHLSKRHGDRVILDDVSFVVRPGDKLGIIGLSGVGKSTLLDILLGFDTDYSGDVLFCGVPTRELSQEALFEVVGYYPQAVGIFNDSLSQNVVLGAPDDPERFASIVDMLSLQHLLDRNLGEAGGFISGGERHRVALARLLYSQKKLFVIDEPLLNLDAINELSLLQRLGEMLRASTAVIISHRPEVLRLAETLLVLDQGRVAEVGPTVHVLDHNSLCCRLVESHQALVSEAHSAL